MNARARETSTVVITALLGKGGGGGGGGGKTTPLVGTKAQKEKGGGGGTNVHPHKTNEGEKGRGLHTTSIPHTSNIIIHDSAAVTVFGTVHSSQANLNHFITVLASSGRPLSYEKESDVIILQ